METIELVAILCILDSKSSDWERDAFWRLESNLAFRSWEMSFLAWYSRRSCLLLDADDESEEGFVVVETVQVGVEERFSKVVIA